MPSESHKHSKGQPEQREAIAADKRAIKTQVASKYSFEQLIHRIKMGNPL